MAQIGHKPSLPANCVLDQSQTTVENNYAFGLSSSIQKAAQSFQPTASHTLCQITLKLLVGDGSPSDNIKLEIYSNSGSAPGSLLQTADNTISASQLDGSEKTFSFSNGPVLVLNTTYWLVVSRTGSLDDVNYYSISAASRTSPDAYTRGTLLTYISSWGDPDPTVFDDAYFKEYYSTYSQSASASGSKSASASASSSVSSSASKSVSPSLSPSASPSTSAPPLGILTVNPTNSRYFNDGTGNSIILVGPHNWANIQDRGNTDPPTVFDNAAYLAILTSNGCNFTRGWSWEEPVRENSGPHSDWKNPIPYLRTGPGNASDGKLKFDLTHFDQTYFDRLRQRCIDAGTNGIYISIMLFDGWSVRNNAGYTDPWPYHPYKSSNNINSVNGDPDADGDGEETQELSISLVTTLQEAYVTKVIDTVNDLDNIIYEISNESSSANGNGNLNWQNHFIDYIHTYELTKAKKHLVWFTPDIQGNYWTEQQASNAEVISPTTVGEGDYNSDPPVNSTGKIVINDTDHGLFDVVDRKWAWKSFTRGNMPIQMDALGTASSQTLILRANMGYILAYSKRIDLNHMTPQGALSSTGYMLAKAATFGEYISFNPSATNHVIDLTSTSGTLDVEWLNPATGAITSGGTVSGGASRTLTPPFSGDSVVYLVSQGASPSLSPSASRSPSFSASPSQSPSSSTSSSPSSSQSPSGSTSASASSSPSRSLSPSASGSASGSASASNSASASGSASGSKSASSSGSASLSPSPSNSASPSPSGSTSASASSSGSASGSASASKSLSPSASQSPSSSQSPSASPSAGSSSLSPSGSPSASQSPSASTSRSVSPSVSPSLSPSGSPSKSASASASASGSASNSASASASGSASNSPSLSPSPSVSASPSPSSSVSASASASASKSASASTSNSLSPSGSQSPSQSQSPSSSASKSQSPSASASKSLSPSASASPSFVQYILYIDYFVITRMTLYTDQQIKQNTTFVDQQMQQNTSFSDQHVVQNTTFADEYKQAPNK